MQGSEGCLIPVDANNAQAVDDVNCVRMLCHYRQNSCDLRCVEAIADETRSIGPYYLPHVKRLVVTIDDCGHENVETVLRDGMRLCRGALTMISEVVADMPAAQKGVRVGDIICAVNGSDEHMFGQHDFGQELISLKNKEKTLLIARWTACGYVLHKISFDALALGISFLHGVQVPDDIFQQLGESVRDFAFRK